eukprot:Macronucleus_6823.p1 GENE.Macronucleus_6823~~Macronucleus_6823.p1  ORF type:complete len:147 (+),score=30.02 Macronucleus_6823:1-441(+)
MMVKQRAMQVEMAMKQRQAMLAMQREMALERFSYYCCLVGLAFSGLPVVAFLLRKPQMVIPLLPMSFTFMFQYDLLYGNMMVRAQKEAARSIREEPERFFLPEDNQILDQAKYNEIMGLPRDYKPKLDAEERVFSVLKRHILGGGK